jgi:hypothetical protein
MIALAASAMAIFDLTFTGTQSLHRPSIFVRPLENAPDYF